MSSATTSRGRTRGVAVLVASILLIIGAVVYIAFARSNSTGSDFKGAGNGVEQIVEIELNDEAKANLTVSVDAVKELLVACKGIDSSLS